MRRRAFIAGLGSAVVWPELAIGQQTPVIGFLSSRALSNFANLPGEKSCGLLLSGYIDASHFLRQSTRALDEIIFDEIIGGGGMQTRVLAILGAALVWGTGGVSAALAADMPVKAPPVIATVFSWTGFYVGGHVGYAWGDTNASAADTAAITATYGGMPHPKGGFGGLHGGYNVQLANKVVVGVEASVEGFGVNGVKDTVGIPPLSQLNVMTDWAFSVVGRGGYAFDRWLPYVFAGGIWLHDKENGFNPFIGAFNNLANWHSGVTAGVGVEYAFASHWSARAQYRYIAVDRQVYNRVEVGGTGSSIDIGAAYHF